jgi:glucosyl-3-phosphoglycerate synthase
MAMSITIVVPVLNEEQTVGSVVRLARSSSLTDEVIVVDDGSQDETVAVARAAGASVIFSTRRGKGISMYEGLLVASGEFVAFLDGDIGNYVPDLIERLAAPLLSGEGDFVKSTFGREAGRVTELVARPLLSLLCPAALRFTQPLSGIIAGRRDYLLGLQFENDYGVDIGLLLDALARGGRVVEVDIGYISNKMKQWNQLGPMAREVAAAVLKRAQPLSGFSAGSAEKAGAAIDQMAIALRDGLRGARKLALFDLDNTLFDGRFIARLAEVHGFGPELGDIVGRNRESFLITKLVARLLKGLGYADLLAVARSMPFAAGAAECVAELKRRGYVVGIISDGYDFVARHAAAELGADFAVANELEFVNAVATGEVRVPSAFVRTGLSLCGHAFCKSNVMIQLVREYGVPFENVVAVGDSEYDACMIRYAGIGVAFCPTSEIPGLVADHTIETRDLRLLLQLAR